MTKVFEALERAKKGQGPVLKQTIGSKLETTSLQKTPRTRPPALATPQTMPAPDRHVKETLAALHHRIDTMLPEPGGKTLQFMGTHRGEGTSVLVREFAKICAFNLGKSVVLLDANQREPSQLRFFNIEPQHGWEECLRDTIPFENTVHRVGEEKLYVGQVSVHAAYAPRVFDLPQIGPFFEGLKQNFDLILIDAPPAGVSPDGFALSRRMDGVVLVVEAEKTRRLVAKRVVADIEQHGGHVLGVILNNRRYPIPSFVYKWL
jgi:protein-tyrosine kinase